MSGIYPACENYSYVEPFTYGPYEDPYTAELYTTRGYDICEFSADPKPGIHYGFVQKTMTIFSEPAAQEEDESGWGKVAKWGAIAAVGLAVKAAAVLGVRHYIKNRKSGAAKESPADKAPMPFGEDMVVEETSANKTSAKFEGELISEYKAKLVHSVGRLMNLHEHLMDSGADWYKNKSTTDRFQLLKSMITDSAPQFKTVRTRVDDVIKMEVTEWETGKKVSFDFKMIEPDIADIETIIKGAAFREKTINPELKENLNLSSEQKEGIRIADFRKGRLDAAFLSILYDAVAQPSEEKRASFLDQALIESDPGAKQGKLAPDSPFGKLFASIKGAIITAHGITDSWRGGAIEPGIPFENRLTLVDAKPLLGPLPEWETLRPVDGAAAPKVAKAVKAGQAKIVEAKAKAPAEKVK